MNYALIGYPLTQSLSPFIHKELFTLQKSNSTYTNIEIAPENLNADHIVFKNFAGFNVTIPHKLAIIPYLTQLCGQAKVLRTVNTVVINNDGTKLGYNTDCEGFMQSLTSAGITLSGKVLICGYGGTARMMCHLAAQNGCNITVSCRKESLNKAKVLTDEIESVYKNVTIKLCDNDNIEGDFDLLLNGTPAGMYPKNMDLLPVPKSVVLSSKNVFDAVYNPRETLLLKTAKANGSLCALGMPMLVYQAAAAQKIWTGADFNKTDLDALIEKTNFELERVFSG